MRTFTLTLVALLILTALSLIPRSEATPTQPVTTATPPPSVVRDVPIVSAPALAPKEAADGSLDVGSDRREASGLPRLHGALQDELRGPERGAGEARGASASRGAIAEPIIGGRATWYPASGMVAAAGPALRHYLGKHWRGTLVELHHGGRAIVVRLSDWCACPRALIDLSDDAFAQLAPLSRGVIAVSITRAVRVPDPPPTDTE